MATEMKSWSYRKKAKTKMAGLTIPLLHFAYEIVLIAHTPARVQYLLDTFSTFCIGAGLSVNLDKTVWLVGGNVPREFVPPVFTYQGAQLKQVSSFRYLGLIMSGQGVSTMVDARVKSA